MTPSELSMEALTRARLAAASGVFVLGRSFEVHHSIESTNDRARELASCGEPEGTVVVADEQTRGRGRAARGWHSAPGLGLYMSVILRPRTPPARAPLMGLMAAVAVREALSKSTPAAIAIKWPNDIVVRRETPDGLGKLAGILTESRATSELVRDLVVGVGVNVNHLENDFPAEIAGRATSLRLLGGAALDRAELAAGILTAMDGWYTLWARSGDQPILEAFRAMALDLEGRRVRVVAGVGQEGVEALTGTTAGLAGDGALRVLPDGGGRPVDVRYGDVMRVVEVRDPRDPREYGEA